MTRAHIEAAVKYVARTSVHSTFDVRGIIHHYSDRSSFILFG